MTEAPNDIELCRRWYDEPAKRNAVMTEWYARYSRRLYAFCRGMTNDDHDASDLFQEVWLKYNQYMQKEHALIEHVGAFLLRSARNLMLNSRRSTGRFVQLEDLEMPDYGVSYEYHETLRLLHQALDLLPNELREVFVMHDMEGMSYNEMVAITGETVGVLRTRLWRGRTQIRSILLPLLKEGTINE